MKLEFFIDSVYYYPDNPIPSVIVVMRNNIDSLMDNEPIILNSKDDMKKAFKNLFLNDAKTHKTSFMVGLDEYRKSGVLVGDRLEIDVVIKNNGDISN